MMSFYHFALAAEHRKICETPEAQEMMGNSGNCQVIFIPQETKSRSGSCTGKLMGQMCILNYSIIPEGTDLSLNCGLIQQDFIAEVLYYRIAGLLKMENGKQTFIDDPSLYIDISTSVVSLKLIEEDGKLNSPTISFNIGVDSVQLTDTLCI
jgi:hypothetical protein